MPAAIEEDYTSRIEALCSEGNDLIEEMESYQDYWDDKFNQEGKIGAFYKKLVNEISLLCIALRDYAAFSTELILDSDLSKEEKADALENINKLIYEDAYEAIDSKIYKGLLDDLKEKFGDGILATQPKDAWADEYHYITVDEKVWNEDAHDDVHFLNYKTHQAIKNLYDEANFFAGFGMSGRMIEVITSFNNATDELKAFSDIHTGNENSAIETPEVIQKKEELSAYLDEWFGQVVEENENNPYTEESYQAFSDTTLKARAVINNKRSTLEDLENAQKAFDDAWYALTPTYKTVDYASLLNSPDTYKDELITKTGQVSAITPSGWDDTYGAITLSTGEGDLDLILVMYPLSILESELVKDESVTVYGSYRGTVDVGDLLNSSTFKGIEIPGIVATKIMYNE